MAARPAQTEAPKSLVKTAIEIFDEGFDSKPLAGKLATISGMLGAIPKNGYNRSQNYKFVQETDLKSAVRPYLAAAGAVLVTRVASHELTDLYTTRSGQLMRLSSIQLDWELTDGKESIGGTSWGYGADTGDKGIYKAITGAVKYILMELFLVDTGDDPERDEKVDEPGATRSRPPVEDKGEDGYGTHSGQDEPRPIIITPTSRPPTGKGGHAGLTTETQYTRFSTLVREKAITLDSLLVLVNKTLGEQPEFPSGDPRTPGAVIKDWVLLRPADDMGKLLVALEAYQVPGDV